RLLAPDIVLRRLALVVEGVEVAVQALVGGFPRVDRAADGRRDGRHSAPQSPGHQLFPLVRPKKSKPFHLCPVTSRARAESDLKRRPFHSKPSSRTVTRISWSWYRRLSTTPGLGMRRSLTGPWLSGVGRHRRGGRMRLSSL